VEKIIVSAIQLNAELGNVQLNFSKAIELIRRAAERRAKIVVLPEFFTSAMAFNLVMEEVAQRNKELNIPQRLYELSGRYGCMIAGSYLNIISEDIYNTMLLQFPNGDRLIHNKDIPTQFENRYYTTGDHNRNRNGVGVALCWEMLRSETVRQMPPNLKIVAAGSCWWDLPNDSTNDSVRNYNHELNHKTPSHFAALLGVPVIHASHVGVITGFRNSTSNTIVSRQLIGTTQIVNHAGEIQKQLESSDGDEILIDEVEVNQVRREQKLPDGFWTVELPPPYLEAWDRENRSGQEYYCKNRHRMIGNLTSNF